MTTLGFTDLVAQAYDSAHGPNGLVNFTRDAANFFNAQQSAMAIWSESSPEKFTAITHGLARKDLRGMFDRRGESGTLFEKLGKLSVGETVRSNARAQTTPAESLGHPSDLMHWLVGLAVKAGESRCAIILFRDGKAGEFTQNEQEELQSLLKYYQRAFKLNKHYLQMFLEHKTAYTVLESSPQGIFFLGQKGQVTYQNIEARMFFTMKDGLRLRDGAVHIDDPKVRKTLDAFIDQTRSGGEADGPDNLVCAIPRKSNANPYQLIISKLPFNANRAALHDDEVLAMAVISDPEDLGELKVELLRTFFDLSAAEARLARALYKFHVLPEAAKAIGISVHTARSELKKIFSKLGVNSQSALLKKLANAIRET